MTRLKSAVITDGVQRTPNRAMLRAVGFGDADFGKPIIGIANGYSTITPCNAGLDRLARRLPPLGTCRSRSRAVSLVESDPPLVHHRDDGDQHEPGQEQLDR